MIETGSDQGIDYFVLRDVACKGVDGVFEAHDEVWFAQDWLRDRGQPDHLVLIPAYARLIQLGWTVPSLALTFNCLYTLIAHADDETVKETLQQLTGMPGMLTNSLQEGNELVDYPQQFEGFPLNHRVEERRSGLHWDRMTGLRPKRIVEIEEYYGKPLEFGTGGLEGGVHRAFIIDRQAGAIAIYPGDNMKGKYIRPVKIIKH